MPSRSRPAMYNTPHIRNGGFGALQVEAITNRPLSIARRHLAASQLRMRDIEPDQLSSSEWVRFLVMEERERERWMSDFNRRRRDSGDSTSSAEGEQSKADEAAEEARRNQTYTSPASQTAPAASSSSEVPSGSTPAVSLWVRQFDGPTAATAHTPRRPRHARMAVGEGEIEAPPTYESAVRARSPPPAYEPRTQESTSLRTPRYAP